MNKDILIKHPNDANPTYKNISEFKSIRSKETAYITGFILADGYITNDTVSLCTSNRDVCIHEYISDYIGSNYQTSDKMVKSQRLFPRARTSISNREFVKHINKHVGGCRKPDRNVPIIPVELERYMILGIFDADGCITWGRRKDRDRVWHKISFTSQYNILLGVQKILIKIGISNAIRPKKGEDCYVLEFSSRCDVLKFIEYIYSDDFVVLNRKHDKAVALRLELDEFGEACV